jgi:hypothetical protein
LRLLSSSQLEISLAEKDDLLASKDQRINALEEAGSRSTFTTLVESDGHPNMLLASSTPNHVSDDSGDLHPPSDDSWNRTLSLIYYAHSSDDDSTTTADGRWNIPFDEASFDELVAKSSPSGKEKRGVLAEVGFMPIGRPSLWHSSQGTGSPLRPLALRRTSDSPRRSLSKVFMNEKENVTPTKDSIGIGAVFDVR